MTFQECVDRFSDIADKVDLTDIDEKVVQVNIIGKENGNFYLKISEGSMKLFPGEFKDRNVLWIATCPTMERMLDGIMDPNYAYATGKFKMMGDIALGRTLLTRIKNI